MPYYNPVDSFRKNAVEAAQDLGYGDAVVKAVNDAKTIDEMSDIMRKARHEMFASMED